MNTYYSLKNSSLLEAIHPSSTSPQKSIDAPPTTGSANEASLPASYASPVSTDHRSQCVDALVEQPNHSFAHPTSANVPMSVLGEPQAAMDDSSSYYHYLACSTDPEATKLASNKDVKPASLRMKPNAAAMPSSMAVTSTGSGNTHVGGFPSYQTTTDLLDPIESSVFYWWLDELGQPQPMTTTTPTTANPAHMYMYNGSQLAQSHSQTMASSPTPLGSKSAPPNQSYLYPQAQHALMPLQMRASTPSSASTISSVSSQGNEPATNAHTNENGFPGAPSSPSLSTTSPSNADCLSESGRPLRKRTYKKTRLTEAQKRDNHLASEQKRRGHYKQAVENLVNILPKPGHGEADRSQCHLIWRAVHFIRALEQNNQSIAFQLQQPLMMSQSQSQGNAHMNGSGRSGGSFITM